MFEDNCKRLFLTESFVYKDNFKEFFSIKWPNWPWKRLEKIAHIEQSNLLIITKMTVKIEMYNSLCILTLLLGSGPLATEPKRHLYGNFLICSYLFNSIYSGIVWIGKLHDFDEETCFLWKAIFSFIVTTVAKRKLNVIRNLDILYKLPLK